MKIKINDRVTTIHNYRTLWGTVMKIVDTKRPNINPPKSQRYRAHIQWDSGRIQSINANYLYKDGEKPIQLRGKELIDPKRRNK